MKQIFNEIREQIQNQIVIPDRKHINNIVSQQIWNLILIKGMDYRFLIPTIEQGIREDNNVHTT